MSEALKIIVPALAGIIVAAGGFWIGAKKAKTAADASAVEGWSRLASEYATQFENLTAQVDALREEVGSLRSKITELEAERDEHNFWRRIGVAYITTLVDFILAAGLIPPVAPPGLRLDTQPAT